MRMTRLTSVGLRLIFVLLPPTAAAGREQAASAKSWVGRHQEVEDYLKTAEVVDLSEIGIGVTNPSARSSRNRSTVRLPGEKGPDLTV